MQSHVLVRLSPRGKLLPALLSDERAESSCGGPVVVVEGEDSARGPGDVQQVHVHADCPMALFDAAIASGYYVTGIPRQKGGVA